MVTEVTSVLPSVEAERPWPAQGEWTYEDYLRLPTEGTEYVLLGQFGPGEQLHSEVLPDLALIVDTLLVSSEVPGT